MEMNTHDLNSEIEGAPKKLFIALQKTISGKMLLLQKKDKNWRNSIVNRDIFNVHGPGHDAGKARYILT